MRQYNNILVIIEPKRDQQLALERAIQIARFNPKVTITALRLIYNFTNEIRFLGKKTERDTHQDAEEATKAEVDRQIADTLALHPEVKDLNIKIVPKLKWVSDIADGMLEETNSGLYDLLIKGANHHGILDSIIFTPHDWFQNGNTASLHMTLDDATDEILSGWFMPTECQLGYCYAFKIMFEKYGLPQSIYSDRTTILWNPKNGELTQVSRMLDELGIELIYANTPQAKGKIENKNKVVQNRLLNDIKRFNIKTYDELNKWFNDYYIDYLNKKFSYSPLEEETDFIPLDNTDLSTIMCIKVDRKILNGNMISINNNYYIPINSDGSDFVFYKGTTVEVWQDVFTNDIRIFKNNKIYNTRKVKGHRVDMEKKVQKIIEEQKQLEVLLRERDERLKARAKHS